MRRKGKIFVFSMVLLALLIEAPTGTLGQLEAVSAVLQVVPVTSILATAGLVGVKLAALSRLLDVLGYDRAYLAQNLGTGTAAAPIGLETRYAYMFPYVPGLNISVKGEDSIGMPKESVPEIADDRSKAVAQGQVAPNAGPPSPPARRKTYPSMALPANYEHQKGPFRGSKSLKEIFSKVGIQAHFPTESQQEQLQQKFNLPPQGKDRDHFRQDQQQQLQQSNMHSSVHTANDNDPNRNDEQQIPPHTLQQHQTYLDKPPTTNNNQRQTDVPQRQQLLHAFIPSNVAPNRGSPPQSSLPPSSVSLSPTTNGIIDTVAVTTTSIVDDQSAIKPLSSNSHQNNQQQQPISSNQNQSPTSRNQPAAGTATQVNMPHPHYNRPPQNQIHAVIPQREFFSLLSRQRHRQSTGAADQLESLIMGHLSGPTGNIDHESGGPALAPFRAVPLRLEASNRDQRNPFQFRFNSAVPDSFKPGRHPELVQQLRQFPHRFAPRVEHEFRESPAPPTLSRHSDQRFPPSHPTVASLGPGFSPLPNEMTSTNFFPRPFDADDSPTLIGDRATELDRTQPNRRRKKRSALSSFSDRILVSQPRNQLIGEVEAKAENDNNSQRSPSSTLDVLPPSRAGRLFGMPVSNINNVRKRRQIGLSIVGGRQSDSSDRLSNVHP